MISPHFVCLSMVVNGRAWDDCGGPYLSWMDCLALAIQCDEGDEPMPPLVAHAAADLLRIAKAES